ncbi:protein inscuteable homolog [Babylonia areolata]|uniref:protein inscuteable homolog n=1 Tax=Babylonia areolata TaxID=304850 RepID=UPI003FD56F31
MDQLSVFQSCRKGSAVRQWLSDLCNMTEMECMSVLQGKPLHMPKEQTDPSRTVKDIKDHIDVLKEKADEISSRFAHLFQCLEESSWKELHQSSVTVSQHVHSLIQACNGRLKDVPVYVLEQQSVVKGESAKLVQQTASFCVKVSEGTNSVTKNRIPLINQLTFLGQSFSRLVDVTLGHLVQKIVDSLTSGRGLTTVHAAIACIIGLGLGGEHMCFIVAREGGVRGLLDVCRRETLTFTRSQALRALATICCAPECIVEFERERGVELLVDLLCDTGSSGEAMQGEAAGVVAQLTSPCLKHGLHLGGLLHDLPRLLQALLKLCQRTCSHEVFLLATAAMANLTFLHPKACPMLLALHAPTTLLLAASTPKARSLFAKDQVATILANMAALPACQVDIRRQGGVGLLVRFLHERCLSLAGKAETAACERVQQKAAIALSRLCSPDSDTEMLMRSKAIPRLVELCRHGEARNKSDAVMVACLAALRKICSVNGAESMQPIDYQQLVQPQLMDSFLICSHTDENFV